MSGPHWDVADVSSHATSLPTRRGQIMSVVTSRHTQPSHIFVAPHYNFVTLAMPCHRVPIHLSTCTCTLYIVHCTHDCRQADMTYPRFASRGGGAGSRAGRALETQSNLLRSWVGRAVGAQTRTTQEGERRHGNVSRVNHTPHTAQHDSTSGGRGEQTEMRTETPSPPHRRIIARGRHPPWPPPWRAPFPMGAASAGP